MKKKRQQWYKHTEKLLYSFKGFPLQRMVLMQKLENQKLLLMPSVTSSYEPKYSTTRTVQNTLETAVLERIEWDAVQKLEVKIKNLEHNVDMIEAAMDVMLTSEQRNIVRLHYFEQHVWFHNANILGMSKSTYFRAINLIIIKLAWSFNILPDRESREFMMELLAEA